MRPFCVGFMLVSISLIAANLARAQPASIPAAPVDPQDVQLKVVEPETQKIGMIYIVGNEVTRDSVILQAIKLYPGQTLRLSDIRAAEENLNRLGIFETKDSEVAPSVRVLDSDDCSRFKDILVRVRETQTGRLSLGIGMTGKGRVVIDLTIEERNFDPYRLPTCMEDIWSGRAFRGAGQKIRLNLRLR